MKIVTFNLKCVWHDSEGRGFDRRAEIVFSKIHSASPDVIAFQEATEPIIASLREGLPDYDIVFAQRDADMGGEGLATAYRRGAFELLTLDRFWLSPDPGVPGSRFKNQSQCPRICQCSLLRRVKDGLLFRVYNVHLDHQSEEACRLGIGLVLKLIKKERRRSPLPLFLLGDFNVLPDSAAVRMCSNNGALTDLTADISGTFHDFGIENPPSKIDYIFTDKGTASKLLGTRLWTEEKDGLTLSDHYPVEAELDM